MNAKILFAFLGGAALASGVVYMAVKPDRPVTRTLYVASQPDKSAPPADPQEPAAEPRRSSSKSPVVSEETETTPRRRSERVKKQEHVRKDEYVASRSFTRDGVPDSPPVQQKPQTQQVAQNVAPPLPAAPPPVTPAYSPGPATPPLNPATTSSSAAPPVAEPPKVEPHVVTLAAGTSLNVRLGETLSTQRNKPGDTFTATLEQPLVIDGFVIAERGARCEGRVLESDPGGRVKGVAHLELELTSFHSADGQRVRVHTTGFGKDADTSHKSDAAKVGGGAALGAIIGAIAGGGRGAAIGAGAGGAAGAGDVAMTRGKPAELRVESEVSFRVQDPVTITEKLD